MNTLEMFGWTHADQIAWGELALQNVQPARVIADFGTSLKIATPDIMSAELSGKLAHYSERDDAPKVGDWVAVAITEGGNATIETIVLRTNEIARKVAGKRVLKQVIAANVDIAFVLVALDADFSVERLNRYLYQLSISNIEAMIVLNKADKTNDIPSFISQLDLLDESIIVTTATDDSSGDLIAEHIKPGKTAIFLGSSGVGKSTLTNKLLKRQAQQTKSVRASDSTGMHTTVHRELFLLKGGGMLIDTPGIRELQLWGTEEDLAENFDDITDIAAGCKYANCRHGDKEDGCAIQTALGSGALDEKHYANYLKMKSELVKLTAKKNALAKLHKKRPRFYNDDGIN